MSRGWTAWAAVMVSLCLFFWGSVVSAGSLTGRMDGYDWLEADAGAKQTYCERAYRAFRASPSQSYIISSNVQAMTSEGFCKRMDQFYSYDINVEIPLDQAAATAPLLFSDHPVG